MTGTGRVLVAGVGNVFLGDDGFGVEVARRLAGVELPARVDVADYGIRGMHLAYDLSGGAYDVLVLVDALPLDEAPGTVAVLDVDVEDPDLALRPAEVLHEPAADGHGMDPVAVLRLLRGLGGGVAKVLVVGCRPAVIEERMELSPPVAAAVDEAVRTVYRVAAAEADRLDGGGPTPPGRPRATGVSAHA
jgi:hydrogenase maturation protease